MPRWVSLPTSQEVRCHVANRSRGPLRLLQARLLLAVFAAVQRVQQSVGQSLCLRDGVRHNRHALYLVP